MRRLRYLMAFLVAMTFGLTVAPSPAHAAVTWWRIQDLNAHMCITNPNSSSQNLVMEIWTCGNFGGNQRWAWVSVGSGRFVIQNQSSGKCLTVQNASRVDNAKVIQYDCNFGNNQLWTQRFRIRVNANDYYEIINVNSGRCLTVQNNSRIDGADLLQFGCNRGYNQAWTWWV